MWDEPGLLDFAKHGLGSRNVQSPPKKIKHPLKPNNQKNDQTQTKISIFFKQIKPPKKFGPFQKIKKNRYFRSKHLKPKTCFFNSIKKTNTHTHTPTQPTASPPQRRLGERPELEEAVEELERRSRGWLESEEAGSGVEFLFNKNALRYSYSFFTEKLHFPF